ncbi:MAG: hypothetical protein RH860_11040 [Cytophagales bacterium]
MKYFILLLSLIVFSCKDDDSDLAPVNNVPYLVEIDTFSMLGYEVNAIYPCNNVVYFRNFGKGYKYRINSYPINFDPKVPRNQYTGIFRVFPDSIFQCTSDAIDPPRTYDYINMDLLYFKVLQ